MKNIQSTFTEEEQKMLTESSLQGAERFMVEIQDEQRTPEEFQIAINKIHSNYENFS